MAVHNGECYLQDAMESILRQSFCEFEFLIVDDASTDRTRELVLSYKDPRVRLIENREKLGQTRSLNRGLELANGEFVARQDADDISEPERLAKQAAFLETNRELALLGTWYKKIDARGAALGLRELPCKWLEIRWALIFFCPFVHSSVMLRKATVLEKVGFYNEAFAYAQDYELWSRIAAQLPVANLPEYLVRFHMSAGSMTSTYGDIVHDEIQRTASANLAALIGGDQANRVVQRETEFANMSALLFGGYRDLSPQEAIEAARQILCLDQAFCRYADAGRRAWKRHNAELRSRIARRFVEIGHRRGEQNTHLVKQLLMEAYRIYWPLLIARRSLGLCLKLNKRSRLAASSGGANP
jgi:glycosyltransferase involved in cell wall biosynthesis